MLIACALGFVLAGFNFSRVVATSPAFVEQVQLKGVFGEWGSRDSMANYDRAQYLFQKAYGYLNADLIASDATENAGELASAETGAERARIAQTLLETSLSLDPANAHAWTALAWARVNVSSIADARAAMQSSWELAPHHVELAIDRLNFVRLLTGPLDRQLQTPITAQEMAQVRRDLSTLARYRPDEFSSIMASLDQEGIRF